MSLIGNNPLMVAVSGMLGDTVYYRKWRGRLVMCKRPKKRESLSPLQKKTVARFTQATKYAAGQMLDEEAKAAYQARTNYSYHSAYLVALNDYLNAPTVKEIRVDFYRGVIGDEIVIEAWDDFDVVKVNVVIRDTDGAIIEEGDAKPTINPALWSYNVTIANPQVKGIKITAMAFDKPRNVGVLEVVV